MIGLNDSILKMSRWLCELCRKDFSVLAKSLVLQLLFHFLDCFHFTKWHPQSLLAAGTCYCWRYGYWATSEGILDTLLEYGCLLFCASKDIPTMYCKQYQRHDTESTKSSILPLRDLMKNSPEDTL